MEFIKSSTYTRSDIHQMYFDEALPREGTGNWTSGYVRVEDEVIVFMNIGVPGRTYEDYGNEFDRENQEITWFGKPKTHSKQPLISKIINEEITTHFFARWDNSNVNFEYLGIGKVVSYEDSFPILRANGDESFAIKMQITLNDKIKEKAITPKKFNIDTQISLVDLVETDSESLAKTRKEQSKLRHYLFGNQTTKQCSLCHDVFPSEIMVAAHIKPRQNAMKRRERI